MQQYMQDPKRRRMIMGIGAGVVAVLVVVVLVLALGGGSDDDEGGASSGAAGGGGGGGGGGGSGAAAFCRDWPALSAVAAGAQGGRAGSAKAEFEQTTGLFKALASSAPADIRDDFKTYANAFDAYAAVMKKADYDYTKVSAADMGKAVQAFSDRKVIEAGVHIGEWIVAHCTAS